ncbi:hypothetical protein AVEN_265166-1 [Araneus ventricosus]|uniref:RNase H type-1 domain-containing protein n=1 Tax=Araneus ventricosus TaxID=182803 RepID=A0A4Y2CQE5_ARAVE|nr:hypothetical protein AVEN_265166-1 [Araneus ventricosus]
MQSDSQAAIQSISSFELPLTPEISHCQELLRTLTLKGERIVLQWVTGHCGLWGNEQLDFLAKKVANLLQHPNTATSYWKIKLFLKNLCTSNCYGSTALKSWRRVSPSSIPDKPRCDAVAAFRLTTGHDCLAAHLHRLGISTEPFCPLCDSGEVMERDHLLRCGAFQGLTEVPRYLQKQNVRAGLCSKSDEFPLQGLYLDGKKDDTLVVDLAHSKRFRRVKKEEHNSLIQEPGSVYIGHVTPTSGSSEDIVTFIISYLSGRGISLEKLVVKGCDGTAVITSWLNGLIRRIEIHLRKPLQWAVCLLHFNELPFRQYLDGKSTGPKSLRGPIGEKLSGCEKRPVIGFKRFDCQIPTIDRSIPRRWNGSGGPARWPSRSADLSSLDYFLWGHLKAIICGTPVASIEDLVARLSIAAARVHEIPVIYGTVRRSLLRRYQACIDVGSRNFEHLL